MSAAPGAAADGDAYSKAARHDGGAPPSFAELKRPLEVAKKAALKAGKFLLAKAAENQTVDSQPARDVKLAADRESEKIILPALRSAGDIPVLAEESGASGAEHPDGLRWIVDPIDGTVNFLRGVPLCCVSIGLWQKDKPLMGVVHDFSRGELFTGIVGAGAYLNGEPIKVSDVAAKDRAMLATGFPAAGDFSTGGLARFVEDIRAYHKIRLLGSAALSLAYVAAGRVDAYQEKDIRTWDVAAGLALVLAAGGKIELGPPKKAHCRAVFASNARL